MNLCRLQLLALASLLPMGCLTPPVRSATGEAPATANSSGAVGPEAVPYKWRNVVILGGGFVSGIIFSPVERDLIYARTDIGGAYRFNPKDKSWIPLTDMFGRDDANFWGIESIAPDPTDANKVYMAAGTYTQTWAGDPAMLSSEDRGATWKVHKTSFRMGGNEDGRSNGERLAVDPNSPEHFVFWLAEKWLVQEH